MQGVDHLWVGWVGHVGVGGSYRGGVSICGFLKPYELLFLEFESFVNVKYEKSLNNFTCHLSWLSNLCPIHTNPLISICEFLLISICEFSKTLQVIFS